MKILSLEPFKLRTRLVCSCFRIRARLSAKTNSFYFGKVRKFSPALLGSQPAPECKGCIHFLRVRNIHESAEKSVRKISLCFLFSGVDFDARAPQMFAKFQQLAELKGTYGPQTTETLDFVGSPFCFSIGTWVLRHRKAASKSTVQLQLQLPVGIVFLT